MEATKSSRNVELSRQRGPLVPETIGAAMARLYLRIEVANMRTYQLAAALAFAAAAGSSQAAPLPLFAGAAGHTVSGLRAEMLPVVYRRCWWRNGQRHCRRFDGPSPAYGYKAAGGDYYEQDSRKLPFGSQRWWDIKEREGSAGRP